MVNAPQLFRDDEERSAGRASDDELRHITGISAGEERAMEKRAEKATGGGDTEGRLAQMRQRFGGMVPKFAKNKWLLGLAGAGGLGIVALIFFLFVMLNAFKVPNLMENITKWQFARVSNQVRVQNQRVYSTKIALEVANEKDKGLIRQKYGDIVSRFDQYRPSKVAETIYAADRIEYTYTGKQLTAITINGEKKLYPKPSFGTKFIPGYQLYRDSQIAASLAPDIDAQYFKTAVLKNTGSDKIGFIVRSQVNNQIRKQLGISLVAWKVGQFAGKDRAEARRIAERESVKRIATDPKTTIRTSPLRDATDDVKETATAELQDDAKLDQAVKENGVLPGVKQAIDTGVKPSMYSKTLDVLNPVYGIAMPLCIVYDGSMSNAKDLIDAQSAAQIKTYNMYASVADQTKDGNEGQAEALGAYSDKLGTGRDTPAYQRADGKKVTTDGAQSAQAAATGSYTLFNAMFGGDSTTANVANASMDKSCGFFLNDGVAIGMTAANIAATIASFGGTAAAGKAAGEAVQLFVKSSTTKIVDKMLGRAVTTKVVGEVASRTASQKVKRIVGQSALEAGATAGATILAKSIVAANAGQYYNGLEQDTDLANSIDAGGNLNANELMRQQNFGRPLNLTETKQAYARTITLVEQENSKRSTYERYLALSNADSVLSRTASAAAGMKPQNILNYVSPGKLFSSIAGVINPRAMAAASDDPDSLSYGNIQWGWSDQELKLLTGPNSEDYSVLENNRILEASGRSADIEAKYGKCFSGDSAATIGSLMQSGAIVRGETGEIIEQGDCAPGQLGPNNPSGFGDLVFRWRIKKADDQTLADQINLQEITEAGDGEESANTGAGASLTIASFNILGAAHTGSYIGRANKSLGVIKDEGVDIVGVQEFQTPQQRYFKRQLGSDWKIYPNNDKNQNAIMWNSKKFKLMAGGTIPDQGYFRGERFSPPYIRLKAIEGGQQIYVLNTHDPVSNPRRGDNSITRYRNNVAQVKFIKELRQRNPDIPIFFAGDFNASVEPIGKPGTNGYPYQGNAVNLAYCILSGVGGDNKARWGNTAPMRLGYDVSRDRNAKCPNPIPRGEPSRITGIDHIYVSNEIKLEGKPSYYPVSSQKSGSDHPMIVAKAIVPGIAVEGSDAAANNGWTWPISKANYSRLSQCLERPGHTGLDIPVPNNTPVLAARAGKVIRVEPNGGDAGQYIIIEHGKGQWSNYQHNSRLLVKVGQTVKAGDVIARSGNSGYSTGPHSHFSITTRNYLDSRGAVAFSLDPLKFLPKDRKYSCG